MENVTLSQINKNLILLRREIEKVSEIVEESYLELDDKAKIVRAKFRDISKHNWKALEHAVLKNIVPDFPLCNKSFSLAYAAVDM